MYNDFRVLEPWWLLLCYYYTHMLHGEHMQHTERFYENIQAMHCSRRNHLHKVLVAMQLSECAMFLRDIDLNFEMTNLCHSITTTQPKLIYL